MSKKFFKVQAVAAMLGVSVDTVRRDSDEAGIEVRRQGGDGPKTRLFSVENLFELAAFRIGKYGVRSARKLIFTIYAPKGGVGKTTTASNFACTLALKGFRVLVIDLDFQANLTIALGYDPELEHEEARELDLSEDMCVDYHLGHLLPQWPGQKATLSQVLKKPFGEHGPHLIPSDVTFDRIEALFMVDTLMSKKPELAIARMLQEGFTGNNPNLDLSGYDIILFDAPPAKNHATRAALLASDYVVSPVSLEKYSTKSVSYLAGVLNEMKTDYNKFPELVILGNFYDMRRARVAGQVVALNKKYPGAWLEKQVSTSEEFKKALDDEEMMPLVLSRPTTSAAEQLRAVTGALVERMMTV